MGETETISETPVAIVLMTVIVSMWTGLFPCIWVVIQVTLGICAIFHIELFYIGQSYSFTFRGGMVQNDFSGHIARCKMEMNVGGRSINVASVSEAVLKNKNTSCSWSECDDIL